MEERMAKTTKVCANCGALATGAINGRDFCSRPDCINKVMAGVVKPLLRQTMEQLIVRDGGSDAR
jgi:hypothetical protein